MTYENAQRFTEADLSTGIELAKRLYKPGNNLSVSPLGLRTALSMLYEGCVGNVASQIQRSVGLPTDSGERHEGVMSLVKMLNRSGEGSKIGCTNSLNSSVELKDEFLRILRETYCAGVEVRKSQELIAEIVNVLSFKSEWEAKFDKNATRDEEFTRTDGNKVMVPMMKLPWEGYSMPKRVGYLENDDIQALALPYKGNLENIIVLPKSRKSPIDVIPYLDGKSLRDFRAGLSDMSGENFVLRLPKHSIKGDYDLNEVIGAMGMDSMFQFSHDIAISKEGLPAAVTEVSQKTSFETNEEGSRGEAKTIIRIDFFGGGRSYTEFIANRPFMEVVYDKESGACLFLNIVEDPSKQHE